MGTTNAAAVARWCELIATKLESGMPLTLALSTQHASLPNKFKKLNTDIFTHLNNGSGFADAITTTGVLPEIAVDMIRVGERAGRLTYTLRHLEDYYTLRATTDRKMTQMMREATLRFVGGIFGPVALSMLLFETVKDKFKRIDVLGLQMYGLSGVLDLAGYLLGLIAGFAMTLPVIRWCVAYSSLCGHTALRLPLIGGFLRNIYESRFFFGLGLAYGSGLSITEGLPLALKATGSMAFASQGESVLKTAQQHSLAAAVAQLGLISPEGLDLVRLAEQTGNLEIILLKRAKTLKTQIEAQSDQLLLLQRKCFSFATKVLGLVIAFRVFWQIAQAALPGNF